MRCAPRHPPPRRHPPAPHSAPPAERPGGAAGRGPGNREVIHKLLRWTVLMFTAPFFAVGRPAAAPPRPRPLSVVLTLPCASQYFVCARWLESGPIWAGVAAILVVQVVIFGYVITAFTEDMEVDREPAPEPEWVPSPPPTHTTTTAPATSLCDSDNALAVRRPEPDSSGRGDKKRR